MSGTLAPFLALRQLPPGRNAFAYNEVISLLPSNAPDALRQYVEKALSDNLEAFRLRQRYEERKRGGEARGKAVVMDREIGSTVSGIHALMVGFTTGVDEGDETAEMAQKVLDAAFSGGVVAIVHVPFEIQVATINDFLAKFAPEAEGSSAGPLHQYVEALGLAPRLARLSRQNHAFADELATHSDGVTLADVDVAFQKGQQSHHRAFIQILAAYSDDTPEHIALRTRLVAPVLFQDARVAEHNRRSRNVSDVDPETGEQSTGSTTTPL